MAADFTQTRIDMLRRRWQETASPHVSLQLADLYRQQGRLGDAVEVLEGGLVDNPESVSLRVALGRYRMEAGDARGAAETLRAVVESDPSHLVANKLLVKAYVLLGERQRARDRLDLYSLLNDSDPEIEVLEKSVAAGRAFFDAPRPAEPPGPPFDLPATAGPGPDLTRLPPPPPAAPLLRRAADGRTLWVAAVPAFPEAGAGLDPADWSALVAGGLFEAPAAAGPANGRPAPPADLDVAAAAPRRAPVPGGRREDHVEVRLRAREAAVEEPRATEPEPAWPLPGEEDETLPFGAFAQGPPVQEPPVQEPPPPPPLEEPPVEEPPVEEPPVEEPPVEEPPAEAPPEELPEEEAPVEAPPEEEPAAAEPEGLPGEESPIGALPEGLPEEEPGPVTAGEAALEEAQSAAGEPAGEEEITLAEVLEAERAGETPRPTLTLARLYLEQGHLEEAEETFRAILLREPGNEEARRGLAAAVERRWGAPAPVEEAGIVWPAVGDEEEAGTEAVEAAPQPAGGEAEPIRRRIAALRKYLDGLRAARAAEGR